MFSATWIISAKQKDDGLVINLAGRQRMLSQKMTKEALAFIYEKDSNPQLAAKMSSAAHVTMEVFDMTLKALKDSGPAPLAVDPKGKTAILPAASPEVAAQLASVMKLWKPFEQSMESVLKTGDAKALKELIATNIPLLQAMNKAVGMLQKESESKVNLLLVTQASLVGIGLLLLFALLFVIKKDIINPLDAIGRYTDKISHQDFSATISGTFKAELLALKTSVESMVESMVHHMAEAKAQGEEAGKQALHAQQALEQARAKEAEIIEARDRMHSAALQADSIAEKTVQAAHLLEEQVTEAADGANTQQMRATETATAMEEMNSTVFEVARNATLAAQSADEARERAQLGSGQVQTAVDSFGEIQNRISELSNKMGDLGNQTDSIGQILNVITDIADQTNLLALNAAIEAARAGDAGRGFAVVADEVRKLAEKTMSATKEVAQAIDTIQKAATDNIQATERAASQITTSTEAAEKSMSHMAEIVTIVNETAGQVDSIATAAEEQSATSEEINRAVSDVNTIATDTAQGMDGSTQSIRELRALAQELKSVIETIR